MEGLKWMDKEAEQFLSKISQKKKNSGTVSLNNIIFIINVVSICKVYIGFGGTDSARVTI